MRSSCRPRACLVALSLLAMACSQGEVGEETTTTTSAPVVTTTSEPDTTTTTEDEPCPDAFCVIYHIHPDAVWADGVPVSAADFIFTYEELIDPLGEAADLRGYELISGSEVIDDKTVLFSFTEVYGPWQTLFEVVLPRHVGAGNRALANPSGPFVLADSVDGESITLHRNPDFWADNDPLSGQPLGGVQEIRFVFGYSVRDQLQGLEDGGIDVINPRPLDWIVAELTAMDNTTHQLAPGAFWEHIDFNHDDPLLSQPWVREVINLAIDRESILDETVRTIDPEATALGSTVWPVNSRNYVDHFGGIDAYDPSAAEQILIDHFCQRGEDGIHSCQGRRMSFVWATTMGDPFRERHFNLAQESLAAVGIELIVDYRTPSELFGSDVLFGGPEVWQLINFSWKAGADPHPANSTYHCQGSAPSGFGALNVNRFCDADVESLIRLTEVTTDPVERAGVYSEADSGYLSALAVIPLYQSPSLMAWNRDLTGPRLNLSRSGNLWNVAAWSGKETVVVSLEAEPDSLDPLLPQDETIAMILGSVLYGAYGINSELEFLPVLISEAETIVSVR